MGSRDSSIPLREIRIKEREVNMIRTTVIDYKEFVPVTSFNRNRKPMYRKNFKVFQQYTAENGKSVYTIGTMLVSKEEGNKIFSDIKKKDPTAEVSVKTIQANNADILKVLDDSIDKYTQYIDNYRQQKAAERANDEIYKIISAFNKVANE